MFVPLAVRLLGDFPVGVLQQAFELCVHVTSLGSAAGMGTRGYTLIPQSCIPHLQCESKEQSVPPHPVRPPCTLFEERETGVRSAPQPLGRGTASFGCARAYIVRAPEVGVQLGAQPWRKQHECITKGSAVAAIDECIRETGGGKTGHEDCNPRALPRMRHIDVGGVEVRILTANTAARMQNGDSQEERAATTTGPVGCARKATR